MKTGLSLLLVPDSGMFCPPFILVLSTFVFFYLLDLIDVFHLDCGYGLLCFMFIFVVILLFYMILMGIYCVTLLI